MAAPRKQWPLVSADRFELAARFSGSNRLTLSAVRLVLVDGKSQYQASQQTGILQATISRACRSMAELIGKLDQ